MLPQNHSRNYSIDNALHRSIRSRRLAFGQAVVLRKHVVREDNSSHATAPLGNNSRNLLHNKHFCMAVIWLSDDPPAKSAHWHGTCLDTGCMGSQILGI